jgi:hypothetical protein
VSAKFIIKPSFKERFRKVTADRHLMIEEVKDDESSEDEDVVINKIFEMELIMNEC